jgi:hypothetical protein
MGPAGAAGATGATGATGPAGPPPLAAEGTATTVEDATAIPVSFTLTTGRAYVLRYKTTVLDATGTAGYWEHVQIVYRDGGGVNVVQDVEVHALDAEFSTALVFTNATLTGVRLDVQGEVGRTLRWDSKIYIESDRLISP